LERGRKNRYVLACRRMASELKDDGRNITTSSRRCSMTDEIMRRLLPRLANARPGCAKVTTARDEMMEGRGNG